MTSILERNRNRLIAAKMAEVECRRNMEAIKLPSGDITTIQISAGELRQVLIHLFEKKAYAEMSIDDAEIMIINNYRTCMNRNMEKLNEFGMLFIKSVLENYIELVVFSRVDK